MQKLWVIVRLDRDHCASKKGGEKKNSRKHLTRGLLLLLELVLGVLHMYSQAVSTYNLIPKVSLTRPSWVNCVTGHWSDTVSESSSSSILLGKRHDSSTERHNITRWPQKTYTNVYIYYSGVSTTAWGKKKHEKKTSSFLLLPSTHSLLARELRT